MTLPVMRRKHVSDIVPRATIMRRLVVLSRAVLLVTGQDAANPKAASPTLAENAMKSNSVLASLRRQMMKTWKKEEGSMDNGKQDETYDNDGRKLQSLGLDPPTYVRERDPKVCHLCDVSETAVYGESSGSLVCELQEMTKDGNRVIQAYPKAVDQVKRIQSQKDCNEMGGNSITSEFRFCKDIFLEIWVNAFDRKDLCNAYKQEFQKHCCRPKMTIHSCSICSRELSNDNVIVEKNSAGRQCLQQTLTAPAYPLFESSLWEPTLPSIAQITQFTDLTSINFDLGDTTNLPTAIGKNLDFKLTWTKEQSERRYQVRVNVNRWEVRSCLHAPTESTKFVALNINCRYVKQVEVKFLNLVPGVLYAYQLFQYREENVFTSGHTYEYDAYVNKLKISGDTVIGSTSNKSDRRFQYHPPWKVDKLQNRVPLIYGTVEANENGQIIIDINAIGSHSTIWLTGVQIERARSFIKPPSSVFVMHRYDDLPLCQLDGGVKLGGNLECDEIQFHYASLFRAGSAGCRNLQARYGNNRCVNGLEMSGCCSEAKALSQPCQSGEKPITDEELALQYKWIPTSQEAPHKPKKFEIDFASPIFWFVFIGLGMLWLCYKFGMKLVGVFRHTMKNEDNLKLWMEMHGMYVRRLANVNGTHLDLDNVPGIMDYVKQEQEADKSTLVTKEDARAHYDKQVAPALNLNASVGPLALTDGQDPTGSISQIVEFGKTKSMRRYKVEPEFQSGLYNEPNAPIIINYGEEGEDEEGGLGMALAVIEPAPQQPASQQLSSQQLQLALVQVDKQKKQKRARKNEKARKKGLNKVADQYFAKKGLENSMT